MFDDLARQMLQKPVTARMSTLDGQAFPHTVPVWFMLDGDEVVIFSSATAKKIDHIRHNPKGAVQVGGDVDGELGYLIKGEFRLEADNGMWSRRITHRYIPDPAQADALLESWGDIELIVIRLKPHKVIKVSG